jgi:large subunit ribosomal protein L24
MTNTTEAKKLTLKKNDTVQVIAGRDKGKIGKILEVDRVAMRVKVEKVNVVKRHMKASQQNPQGGIIEKEIPLHYSNVLLMCTKCNKGVRHGLKMAEASAAKGKGKKGTETGAKKAVKVRVCKKCNSTLDAA